MKRHPAFVLLACLVLLVACGKTQPDAADPAQTPVNSAELSATPDSYSVSYSQTLNVTVAEGVLKNDAGKNLSAEVKRGAEHGVLELNPDGSFMYTHAGEASKDSFSYFAKDGSAAMLAEVTLNILPADQPGTPENAAPSAQADSYSLDEGAVLSLNAAEGLLANDADPEGQVLSLKVLNQPEHGDLSVQPDGSFTYTHDHSETLLDSFSYQISDGVGTASEVVTLNITGVDDAPVIENLELAQTHVTQPEGTNWRGRSGSLSRGELHLVGNRPALALVEISAANARVADATLEAHLDGEKLGEVTLELPETFPATEAAGPAYSDTAYWAKLDKAWLKPGLELIVRANEGQTTEAVALNVGAPTSFTMYTLPIYMFGLGEKDIDFSLVAEPDEANKREYYAKHPVSELNMVNHPAKKLEWPYLVFGPNGREPARKITYSEQTNSNAVMGNVLGILQAIRNANGEGRTNNQYYAPLMRGNQAGKHDTGYFGGGLGTVGGGVSTGDTYQYSGTFLHEAGHAFGMPHASGAYDNLAYPYVGGSLKGSNWGYDQENEQFMPTFVPTTSPNFDKCKSWTIQFDAQGRCVKQDPMQGGSGYQAQGDIYTMFSDFNAGVVQSYLENRPMRDANSASGYSIWDKDSKSYVDYATVPMDANERNGRYSINRGLPITHDVPVNTFIITLSQTTPEASQIYPPLSYTGNLLETIDPTNADDLAKIVPNRSKYSWYCHESGCDYSLRVTYADNSTEHMVLQGGFRKSAWSNWEFKDGINDPNSKDSFRSWSLNVSASKTIKKVEVLDTPQVYDGMPANPSVLLTWNAD